MAKIGLLLLKRGANRMQQAIDAYTRLMQVVATSPPPPTTPSPPHAPGRGHMQTQVADGRIVSQYGNAPLQFSEAVMKYWPYETWSDAANLSYLESSWNTHATNDTRYLANGQCNQRYYIERLGIWAQTEWSIGYFQINICAHGHSPDHWYDPDNNASYAASLYHQSGWYPWTYSAGQLGLI